MVLPLAAASAHLADAARLGAASSMLLFHATAVLGALVLSDRGTVNARVGLFAAFGFVTGAGLFAGDLTVRQYADHSLFPMAAPTGGSLMILSWIALSLVFPGAFPGVGWDPLPVVDPVVGESTSSRGRASVRMHRDPIAIAVSTGLATLFHR